MHTTITVPIESSNISMVQGREETFTYWSGVDFRSGHGREAPARINGRNNIHINENRNGERWFQDDNDNDNNNKENAR